MVDAVETVDPQPVDTQPEQEEISEAPPPPPPQMQSMQLTEGLPLSAIVGACWPLVNPKAMLKQNWASGPSAESPDAAPPAAFDPTAASYSLIPSRLAKNKALLELNRLKFAMADKQEQLSAVEKGDEAKKEALTAELDELKAKFDEAAGAFTEARNSFNEDPTSLTPWMTALFTHINSGITTFTVSGDFWPHCTMASAFNPRDGADLTEGCEKLLAAFRKRCEYERGAGAVQVVLRLSPNIFREGFSAEAVNGAVARMMSAQGIDPEAGGAASLDAVELVWWDSATGDAVATLKQLAKLCANETDTDPETGDVTVTVPRKIKALGVCNFSAKDMLKAIAAGVKINFAHCRFGLHCFTEAKEVLKLCKEYDIKVLGDEGTMFGLIDESFLGVPCPSVTDVGHPVQSITSVVALVDECGSWDKVQKMLSAVKRVADKHQTKMQTVALRWQMDHGVVPTVPTSWGPEGGADGASFSLPVDPRLLHVESFLDAEDLSALDALAR